MRLTSTAFTDGMAIPRRYTCDGEDSSPPLAWSEAPAGVRSYVVLCDDPDAPGGTWHHWAAYDVPRDWSSLPAGAAQSGGHQDFKQATNDFQRVGYGGPCPPHRHGSHRYHFRLLALSLERLPIKKGHPSCREIEREARRHALAEAVLVGTYER